MAEFHLLRPWWLLALPVGFVLIWRLFGGRATRGSWRNVVDRALQPYVLARPTMSSGRRWPLVAAVVGWVAASVALSGPTWERVPVPAFRSNEALVVALDLSRSMDATDVEPSRLARAKLKLLDLLGRRDSGQTGLVVFSAHAFTVTPLTTDTHTISSLVGALSTEIMPSQGSLPEAGLTKARDLLRQAGMTEGDILLVSDADVSPRSLDTARDLADEGFRVGVLAVGTEEGAPIRDPDGGFLKDRAGQVVVPSLNVRGLERLANAGRGRFARLAADDRDLDALFPKPVTGAAVADTADEDEDHRADIWRDEGVWLVLLLLPLLASGFRRGWLCAWMLLAVLPWPRAEAFGWSDLWQRADQRGQAALEQGDPARAADLFKDRNWRAAAEYRSGDYGGSAATLGGLDTADAQYNRGNALARSGNLQAALEAYDRALEIAPDDEDARYNRDLVQKLLDQQQQQQQNGQSPQQQNGQNQQAQQGGGASDGEQPPGADSQSSGQSGQDRQQADAAGDSDQGQRDGSREPSGQDRRQADATSSDTPADEAERADDANGQDKRAAAGPDDLEQWASEQAADQWLRRIPQDPGGLLRRKFLYQYQRLGVDQDGNYVWPGDEDHPW